MMCIHLFQDVVHIWVSQRLFRSTAGDESLEEREGESESEIEIESMSEDEIKRARERKKETAKKNPLCCSVLLCAAVCCRAVCCSVLLCAAVCCRVLQCAVCCNVLQRAVVCCSVVQCLALKRVAATKTSHRVSL